MRFNVLASLLTLVAIPLVQAGPVAYALWQTGQPCTLAVACYTGRLTFGTVVATVATLWRATPHSERAPRPARRSPSSRRRPD
ncbi:hypothetical protein C8J57DRAFT_1530751 [Mycena rebaudengoi]|nr:hypothetical protein C8J57DRAFT_1530751 [Mycena rebaudengoi]